MNTNELWQAVLGELELKLSKANFTTWFRHTFITTVNDGHLTVAVPNTFTKAWLEKKYHKDILTILQTFTEQKIKQVVYQVHTHPVPPQPIISEPARKNAEFEEPFFSPSERSGQTNTGFFPSPPSSDTSHDLSLNPKYTFQTFIVGKQNELSHAAAQAVANQAPEIYNPLFIYGGVGLGKTHLLQAIGNEICLKHPEKKILYLTSERFTNEFIHAVRIGQGKEFKEMYRTVDVLMIDDVQFIAGKKETQEEFFHTFNTLHQNNKQIILSSDRPPKAIPLLEDRLRSRFEWGMITDVGMPDFETRVAILEAKCREKNYLLSSDILHHVSVVIQSNVRELEGALNKIIAYHQFKQIHPSLESVKPILSSFQTSKAPKNITSKQLIQTVATYFDLQVPELLGQSREKRLAFPRQIIMFLMREEMKSSYPTIGTEVGGRDHTTAMHAYDKIQLCLAEDQKLQQDIEIIKQQLYIT